MRYTLLALFVFLAACSVPGSFGNTTATPASPTPTLPSALSPTSSPLGARISTLSATPSMETSPSSENPHHPHYELYLTLDYAAHQAGVDERIRYTNQAGQTLSELVLAVEPRLWPGVFNLTDLSVDGQPCNADFSGQRMTLELAEPLAAGASILLEIKYELHIPLENQRYLFGYNARQTNLLDWYPFIVPYKPGKGWVLHNPAPVGEQLVYESADFDVFLKFANTANAPAVAASAPGIPDGEWMHYTLQGARGFSLSASDGFLTSTADAGGVRVTSYYFDGHQAAGAQAASIVAQAVRLFSQKFAAYPYETLSVVESASADGMEADGLFFMAGHFYDTYDGSLENYLTTLSVHETSHQWWYGLVGNDQAVEPWLDEALATYSERIFYAADYPEEVNWWWDFRIRRFNPLGAMNASIYANGTFRTYTNATYFVGAYWLEELRVRVGDAAFFAALADYARQNSRKIGNTELFFASLNRHTSVDYSDIVNEYFK